MLSPEENHSGLLVCTHVVCMFTLPAERYEEASALLKEQTSIVFELEAKELSSQMDGAVGFFGAVGNSGGKAY